MPTSGPSVLLVGAIDHHEFAEPVRWLRARTRLDAVTTVTEALQRCAAGESSWSTLVIAQPRPGAISARDVDRLSRAMPLAHVIALLGSCCEGESRSGRPWPGVVRMYWHQFTARAATQLRMDGAPTSWQLPRTASDAERTDHALLAPPPRGEGLVAICTNQAVLFDALAGVCHVAGYSSVWITAEQLRGVQGPVAVLWHGLGCSRGEWQQLQRLAALARQVPVVALLGFPRFDQVQQATAAGAAAVLPLPFLVPDLWTTLRELTQ